MNYINSLFNADEYVSRETYSLRGIFFSALSMVMLTSCGRLLNIGNQSARPPQYKVAKRVGKLCDAFKEARISWASAGLQALINIVVDQFTVSRLRIFRHRLLKWHSVWIFSS